MRTISKLEIQKMIDESVRKMLESLDEEKPIEKECSVKKCLENISKIVQKKGEKEGTAYFLKIDKDIKNGKTPFKHLFGIEKHTDEDYKKSLEFKFENCHVLSTIFETKWWKEIFTEEETKKMLKEIYDITK